jgi:xanthine dehydrogenase YagT iron-sulfur-binding subunit
MNESSSRNPDAPGFSRRYFLKSLGSTAVATAATQVETVAQELAKANAEKAAGPEAVPVTLQVNGRELKLALEPRVTLLDALRNHSPYTGAKEICDRGTCGGCTVLWDGRPVYACMKLAVEAQGHAITTVEGLATGSKLSPVQQAFIDTDALMCGYCTPGFVLSVTSLLQRNPHPNAEEVKHACAGNVCRCGTYPRILQAALKAAGVTVTSKMEVIRYADLA